MEETAGETLEEMVRNLAQVRILLEDVKADRRDLQDAFRASEDMVRLQMRIDDLERSAQDLDAAIRVRAAEIYAETGEKRPAPGLQVRVGRVPVYDRAEVEAEIKEDWKFALTVDWGLVDKTLKALSVDRLPPWAEVVDVPSVTIASDLLKALDEQEVANE